jgi:hypothetical protein
MTISLKPIPTPTIGSDAHSVGSLAAMLAAITSNLNTLKAAVEAHDVVLDSNPVEYLQETVPAQARVGDKWYETDAPSLDDVQLIKAWVCKTAYTATDGLTLEQKEARFIPASDKNAQDTVASLTSLLDGKASTYQSSDPPAAMDAGDIWIDTTTVSGINQAYVAKADYDYSGGTGAPVAGWTETEIGIHFRISGDKSAQAAAADADGIARSKTVNYLRVNMPGILAQDVTDGLVYEIGDSWTQDVTPYQSYVCYLGYNASDVPSDAGDRVTFLAAHWKAKGDKTAQDAATAAHALADGKITNYRQLTVPTDGDVLDTWFKNFAGVDRDELYTCNATYTAAATSAAYIGLGYGTVEAYRQTFWDQVFDKQSLEAADAAAATANGKTTDWYLNEPPSAAGASDRWMDRDASPIGQYTSLGAYDYLDKDSVTWVTTGTTDDSGANVTLLISDYWEKVSQEDEVTSLTDLANKAESYIDGSKSTFMGLVPPQSSGITYVSGGVVVERPVGIGDTWVKTDLQLVSTAADLSTWHCFRSYTEIDGLTLDGYTGPDRDGSNNLLAPGAVGFNTMNGYNYWVRASDPAAVEAAIDIIALKDGKRSTYIVDSRYSAYPKPTLKASLGGIQLGDIWIDEGDSYKVFKCKQAYSQDGGTFQGVAIPLYVDKATNWLEVSEPEMTAQAILRRSFMDGKRSVYVGTSVPNLGGPANWNAIIGAQVGDLWYNTTTTPPVKYWCSTAYLTGGTISNWTKMDQLPSDPVDAADIARKIYVDTGVATASGLANAASGAAAVAQGDATQALADAATAQGDATTALTALSGSANDSTARTALSGSANDSTARTALSGSANDSTARGLVPTHAALTSGVHGLGEGVTIVGASETQTLTNKTLGTGTVIDFDNVTASNIEVADLKSTAVSTSIATPGVDTKLATEKAVRDAIVAIPVPVPTVDRSNTKVVDITVDNTMPQGSSVSVDMTTGYSFTPNVAYICELWVEVDHSGSNRRQFKITAYRAVYNGPTFFSHWVGTVDMTASVAITQGAFQSTTAITIFSDADFSVVYKMGVVTFKMLSTLGNSLSMSGYSTITEKIYP